MYTDKYNPNDLGYLQRNNQLITESYLYFQKIEPFWKIREYNGNIWWNYIRIFNPNTIYDHELGYNANVVFKNNYYFNVNGNYNTDKYDYYEPRVKNRFYLSPPAYRYNFNLSTDARKKLSFYFHYGHSKQPSTDQFSDFGDLEANLRLGQQFRMNYGLSFNNTMNGVGFVDKNSAEDSVTFAKRNVYTFSNILSSSYVINNKASLRLRIRHYWSGAENKIYYLLQGDGSLKTDPLYSENMNQNYNAFTIDLIFRWIFAPGSEMSVAWKSSSYTNEDQVIRNYFDNLSNTWLNQANSLSLKVLYYIDYNNLKRKK
ncbi:MAG: DUF5916 domain-containing protein [Prolixibacteraceae bacterium]